MDGDPSKNPPARGVPSPLATEISGPGVTAKTITIGFTHARDAEEAAAEWGEALGLEDDEISPPPVNWERLRNVIIEDINRNGGILGRRVVPHVWRYDALDYPTLADYIEAECTYFTQDVEVFSVFVTAGDVETLECYKQAGMPIIANFPNIMDDEIQAANPHYFAIMHPSSTRLATLIATGLRDAGFFRPGARVGIVSFDFPPHRRATGVLKGAIEAQGHPISEAYVTPPRTPEAAGMMLTDIKSAVVRFRAEGVRQVVFMDVNGYLAWGFMNGAEEQHYRGFEYGLTSGSGGDYRFANGERALPAGQMEGAVLLSWTPLADINQPEALTMLPPASRRCRDLFERSGFRFDTQTCCQLAFALDWCNRLRFLDEALEAQKSNAVNVQTFIRGGESLGSSFEPADGFPVTFGRGKHDGPSVYKVARWNPPCECFRYTAGSFPMP